MKLLFAGTPEFAATALAALLASPHSVLAVYTQPDRPAGRGRKLQASPVKQLAEAHGLAVFQPETLRDKDAAAQIRAFAADVIVVAAYGLILPKAILRRTRCINIHASLLPRWRGAAPIQRAILAGDSETGVTIMQMEQRLDSGPMLLRRVCPIEPTDTAATLHDRLATIGASAIVSALDALADGTLPAEVQDEALVTYAAKLEKHEATLDWSRGADALERQVRAFNPYPVAETRSGTTVVRVWQTAVDPEQPPTAAATPGTIQSANRNGIRITTGNGSLLLQKIQLQGGRPLEVRDVLNAHAHLFRPGSVLG